jgi:hypothetical protein
MSSALTDPAARGQLKARLAEPFRDRPVICAIGPLGRLNRTIRLLNAHGSPPPLAIADGLGAGELPGPDDARVCLVETPPHELLSEGLRGLDRYLREELPEHARAAIDDYDPHGEAVWVVVPFVSSDGPLLGRPVLGGRPRRWAELEDKATVDALWESIGVPGAPHRVVPVEAAALAAAHEELAAGDHGTVWSGDARDGINGSGDYVRWVVSTEERDAALGFFADRCDRVRVMPFLEGVPCSIHGCVLPDGTAVFRPLELAVLRGPGRRFVYGGLGTSWDPPAADRTAMRELARRAGDRLGEVVGYRGSFGIDGVLTVEGFRPTELNPRASGGVSAIGAHLDDDLFELLQLALVAGTDPGIAAAELEEWAVHGLDTVRFTKALAIGPLRAGVTVEPAAVRVAWDGTSLTRTDAQDAWTLQLGPSQLGVFAMLTVPAPPPGLRAAVLNSALMAFLDAEVGTCFGPTTPPPDVRVSGRQR